MELLNKLIESIDYASLINTSFRISLILFIAWLLTFLLKRTLVKLEILWVSRAANQVESSSETKKRIETIVRLLKKTGLIALWVTMTLVIFREV
ncbi:MAG: mechanosensitive ion channel family protein, partial [Pseudomonadota bacterium]|nr:mechanosensitive ion channel family protein [Pseudomonadota bacterium]MDO7711862.1 mechanosensitive ion channel family protein [Pseudomonadota bacterium]